LNLSPLLRYLEVTVSTSNTDNDIDSYDDDDDSSDNNNNKHDGDKFREYGDDDGDHDDNNDNNNRNGNKNKSTAKLLTTTKLQQKFHKLTSSLCELLDDYGLVSYLPMSIEDGSMVGRVLAATDNANGYR
jgi:hypothetical protein